MVQYQENKKQIIFPIDIADRVFVILEKYGLKETEQEIVRKIKNHIPFNFTIAGELIRKLAQERISLDDFILSVQKDLGIEPWDAKSFADEINKEVISLGVKKEILPIGKNKKGITQLDSAFNEGDDYREPVE